VSNQFALMWTITDVVATDPLDDQHQTEWRASFRDITLRIRRRHGVFEQWIERAGSPVLWVRWARPRNRPTLIEAQQRLIEAAIDVLNSRALTEAEDDAINLPLLMDLAETYDTAARRVAEAGLYGEELRLRLEAQKYRADAQEIRNRVARQLSALKEAPTP
jgi:hypothetical protein